VTNVIVGLEIRTHKFMLDATKRRYTGAILGTRPPVDEKKKIISNPECPCVTAAAIT
jgi:hypothetical protein